MQDVHAAAAALMRTPSRLADAYRAWRPTEREFTRWHRRGGGVVSRARLDRAYLPSRMLGSDAPAVLAVRHLRPSSEDVVAVRSGGGVKASDHAAVALDIRYSDVAMAPPPWRFPRHLLVGSPEAAEAQGEIQAAIDEAIAHQGLTALQRLFYALENIRRLCCERKQRVNAAQAKERRLLTRELREAEDYLGEGVRAVPGRAAWCRMRGRAGVEERRVAVEERLQEMRAAAYRQRLDDLAFDEYEYGDAMSRSFFEETRSDRVDSTLRKIVRGDGSGVTATRQADMQREARRFFAAPGGFFNLGLERGRCAAGGCARCSECATARLLDALDVDGRHVPPHLQDMLSTAAVLTTTRVRRTLRGMPSYAMPGPDGFPSEFFKLFAGRSAAAAGVQIEEGVDADSVVNPFLQLLTDALIESVAAPEGLPSAMNDIVISLIYKEKGSRDALKNYRPIAVMPTLYKILTRTMAESLHEVMPWLVDNTGFLHDVDTHDNTRLVQDP